MTPPSDTITAHFDSGAMQALADAGEATDVIIHQMIITELNPVLNGLAEREAEAASALRDAVESLRKPEQHLAELNAELDRVTGLFGEHTSRITNAGLPAEDRVMSRGMAQFYDDEVTAIKARVDQAKATADSVLAVVNKARGELAAIVRAKNAIVEAMLFPWQHPLAQQTKAFTFYVGRHLSEIILMSDESDYRWDAAIDQLKLLCQVSGYRTDALSQAEADQRRRDYQTYRDMHTPETTPSALDVIQAQETVITRAAEDRKQRTVVEDLRGAKVPRNYRVPDHMRAPEVASEVRRDIDAEMRRKLFSRT